MRMDRKWLYEFIRYALIALATIGIASVRSSEVRAQEPQQGSAEVQQLKDRLKQLEQTVDELKAQLLAIESSRKDTQSATGEKAAAVVSAAPSSTDASIPKPKPDEPHGESTFSIYGFAMLNSGYEFQASDPK